MAPYYEESPIGAAVGVAGGFLQGQQEAKQQALQQQLLQQQIAQEAARSRLAEEEFEHTVSQDTIQNRINMGLDPRTGQPYAQGGPPPPPDNSSDAKKADWARAMSQASFKMGNTAGANYYKGLADSYDTGAYRESMGAYAQAGVGLRQAQTKNIEGLYDQQIKLAKIKASASVYAAGLRAARAGARARGNPSDSAYASALRAIGSEEVRAAVEASVIQYTQGGADWRATYDPNNPNQQSPPTLVMPQITVKNVTGPDGKQYPQPVIVYQSQPKSSASSSAAPSQTAPQEGVFSKIQHFLFGGGDSQEPTRIVNGRTYYQHADGKWYTSP